MGSCAYCDSNGNRVVFYTKQISVASVSRSTIGFYVYGAPRATQIYTADWTDYLQVCPQYSITPTLGARGSANLSDAWRHTNSLVNSTDPKHPLALPLAPRYERKRVIVGAEWTLVTFEGESDAPTFWLPEGMVGERDQAGVEFGLVVTGVGTVDATDVRWTRVLRADTPAGPEQQGPASSEPVPASAEDVAALQSRRLIVLDRKYEFHFLDKDDAVRATIPLSPTNPNEISRQLYPKVNETDSQYLYVSASVEANFPVLSGVGETTSAGTT